MADAMHADEEESEVLLDPKTSERKVWRDSSGLQREIWRPGDGDGDLAEAYGESHGLVGTLEKRWKFYQLTEGTIKHRINEPPKNVVLDDRACWELNSSNMPRAQLSKHWPQDFSGQGKLRARRPHRGRPAFKDPNATSDKERYQEYDYGGKGGIYYFTGERAYEPILYSPFEPEPDLKAEPEEAAISSENIKPKGHNQYTPVEDLVRNGAQSTSKTRGKYRERVNTFLRRSPSPPLRRSQALTISGFPAARLPAVAAPGLSGYRNPSMNQGLNFDPTHGMPREPLDATGPLPGVVHEPMESIFVEQDEDEESLGPSVLDQKMVFAEDRRKEQEKSGQPQRKKRKHLGYIERLAAGLLEQDLEMEAQLSKSENHAPTGEEDGSRVHELEQQLERANAMIAERDQELEDVKAQLGALQTEMATQRSLMDVN